LPPNPSTPTASLTTTTIPKHPPCIIPFLLCSKDKPEDLGFPAVEPAAAKPKGQEKEKPNVLKQLVNNVLKNPFIWGMALTYFFIYIVRQVGNL
jgi:sugar phosphate permease